MNSVKILQSLEPIFIKAGQLALEMQKGIGSHNKFNTGSPTADIVTEADFAVQEFLLKEIIKTELVQCRLLAEEDTMLTKNFNESGEQYLGIDPIDDTAIYASEKKHWSTIVSLHDGDKILYMFIYFPSWNWIIRIVNDACTIVGETPDLSDFKGSPTDIIYWSGDPEANLPSDVLDLIKQKGLTFRKVRDASSDLGSIALFACKKVAGIYHENMNTYDGLTELAIARTRGLKIHSDNFNGKPLNLSNIQKRETGLYYPGYYLAIY